MLGALANGATVMLGGLLGVLLKKGVPEKFEKTIMAGLAFCVIYIGISGALEGTNTLVLVLSIAIGAVIGTALDLDRRFEKAGNFICKKFPQKGDDNNFSQVFVNTTLLFCVGAFAIVGSLQAGLIGDCSSLYTKAIFDGIFAFIFASTMGAGVIAAGISVLIYEGTLTLLAQVLAPYLTEYVIAEVTCAGSILIIIMGFNLLKLLDVKIMNLTPAMFMPILICMFI